VLAELIPISAAADGLYSGTASPLTAVVVAAAGGPLPIALARSRRVRPRRRIMGG
jgi:hypothetical protein